VLAYAEEVGNVPLRMQADALSARAERHRPPEDRLHQVLELAAMMTRERDLDVLLDKVAKAALDLMRADRAFVLVLEDDEPKVRASRCRGGGESGLPSMTIARRAWAEQREVIAADLGERGQLRRAGSVKGLELRSVMCVPMVEHEETLGAIYVDSHSASEQQLTEASQVMRGLASLAAVAVTNARHLMLAQARVRVAAEIAHDLKNPISVVLSIGEELVEDDVTGEGEIEQIASDLTAAGGAMLRMVNSYLSDGQRDSRVASLSTFLGRLGTRLARVARRAGCVLEVQAEWGVWGRGDMADLERAIGNLFSNALKYSPRGGVITMSLEAMDEEAIISVRDRGPGLPAEMLDAVFERGVQATDALQGHGLGLFIARQLVEDHGGQISAGNHDDGGAVFQIQLPRVSPPP